MSLLSKISISKVKIAVVKKLLIFGKNSSHKASVCLRGAEKLFCRIPFEQHFSCAGSSLSSSVMECDCALQGRIQFIIILSQMVVL